MTTGVFQYVDPTTMTDNPFAMAPEWVLSFKHIALTYPVRNIRSTLEVFGVDVSGFDVFYAPAVEKGFTDNTAICTGYYAEVEALVRTKLPGVHKVFIFSHAVRHHKPGLPYNARNQPVRYVHVDQTAQSAESSVRKNVPADEVDDLLRRRYQVINVWRPIAYAASDSPLAVLDWRSMSPADVVAVDVLGVSKTAPESDVYSNHDRDESGPDAKSAIPEGYAKKGQIYSVYQNKNHKFYYVKDMMPEEVMFIKCFDSQSIPCVDEACGIAPFAPHTAFDDPLTPAGAKGRQSIEVRCLVFYD